MQIRVTQNEVKINKDILNDGEYNIHKCQFDFDEEYIGLVQKAVFSLNDGTPYLMTIVNNECNIPIEVLEEGVLKIGVYAYETNNDELVLRYSPSPDIIHVFDGSYVKDAQNTEPITPTDKEQIEQAITNLQIDVTDLEENKQDTLVSGENIKTINGESVLGSGNIEIDLSNYYNKQEIDQSQASQNANISKNTNDIVTLNNNLTNYSLITETGSQIVLNVNPSNYQMTAILKDKNGNTIYTSNVIDLPIESMIVNVTYDSTTKEIVFTLQNGTTLRVSVADLVSGLVSTDELNTILASYYTKTEIDNLLSGKVDTTTYTQGQATQDANIEENASNIDWLQTLVNQMPHVSGQGTDLSLENVLNYRLMKFLPQGVSSQESTTGKNLLPHSIRTQTSNGVTITNNSDGTYTLNGTASATANFVFPSSDWITFNSGSYIFSSNDFDGIRYAGYYAGGTSLFYVSSNREFTLENDIERFRLQITALSGSTFNNRIIKPMIRLASITDDTYEPYTDGPAPNPSYPFPVKSVTGENVLKISNSDNSESQTYPISLGNIELNSSPDGTIRDGIIGKPNEWYKREYIHKFVITGTELWNKYSTDRYFLNASQISVPLKLRGGTYCTHFKWETSQSSAKLNNCIYITSNNGNLEIYPSQEFLNTYNTAAKFKEYLQTEYSNNNPVIAYYQRLEYTDIPITDTTLISQLNNIYNNAHSYNGITNITTTYEDGNEQMYLDIEALKNVWEVTE